MKKRTTIITAAGSVSILVLAIGFYRWTMQPSLATVSSNNIGVLGDKTPATQQLSTVAFTADLTTDMTVRSQTSDTAKSIIVQLLAHSSNLKYSDQLAITVGTIPAGGLSEVTDYKYRTSNPQLYKVTPRTDLAPAAVSFTRVNDDGSHEQTIFWPDGQRYAAISVTGTFNRQTSLETMLYTLLQSWQWTN